MPVLPITDGAGSLTPDAGSEVLHTMVAPNDQDFRVRHRVITDCFALFEDAMERGEESLPVPIATMGLILKSPAIETLQDEALKRFSYGELAGMILGLVIICSEQYPQHASLSRAVEALENVSLPGGRMPDGAPLPHSRAFLMKQWSAFKPVAHLYAAYEVVYWGNTPKAHPTLVFQDENLLMLLAVSEHYRQKGESLVVKHGRGRPTFLAPGEAWQPPPDLQLPEIRMEEARIPDEVLEAMKKYRAPKKL